MDSHLLEALASGAALAAEFLKVRSERFEAVDANAFRRWLEQEAVPRLMRDSEGILLAVATLKAANHERFDEIQALLIEIRRAVAGPSVEDTWHRLAVLDRDILRFILQAVRHEPFIVVEPDGLRSELKVETPDLLKSARFLDQGNLLRLHEHSGGWAVAPQASGVCLAWECEDAVDYAGAVKRLREVLIFRTSTIRLRTLAEEATVPECLAYYIIRTWADAGLVTFEDNASPYYMGLIYNVTEKFRRSD